MQTWRFDATSHKQMNGCSWFQSCTAKKKTEVVILTAPHSDEANYYKVKTLVYWQLKPLAESKACWIDYYLIQLLSGYDGF